MRRFFFAALLLALALPASAQQDQKPNSLLLVARPDLPDPNFARTVVLVTQTEDGSTVGVILNRPTPLRLSEFLSREYPTENYREPIYLGGPVMLGAIIALLKSESPPRAAAFHVLKDIYLTMHADNIRALLVDPKARYRLYAGFSGWAPRQLESEFMRDGWFVLPADEATLFRASTDGLWEELVEKALRRGPRTERETRGEIGPMAAGNEALQ
ncbi:MAG TPA: YqgE/AlgH family protein [Burkholderiales bacterium]|nr:YqgE/AlgH family protein [Burkholderiales bacterium]